MYNDVGPPNCRVLGRPCGEAALVPGVFFPVALPTLEDVCLPNPGVFSRLPGEATLLLRATEPPAPLFLDTYSLLAAGVRTPQLSAASVVTSAPGSGYIIVTFSSAFV